MRISSMRRLMAVALSFALLAVSAAAAAGECKGNPNALGTSRVITVDAAEHGRIGTMQYPQTLPLADHELVLTFDDGPLPPHSTRVLDILASECVRATFFLVGSMAAYHPALVRRAFQEGHTIATHTQNHPAKILALSAAEVETDIDDGITSVSKALGNARDAVSSMVDLLIEYNSDARANADIGRQMKAAGIPLLAVNYSIPGAPLYTADHVGAGRIAGEALGKFAKENWSDQTLIAAILGDISDPSASVTARIQGVTEGLRQELPDLSPVQLDSAGHSVRAGGVLSKFLTAQTRRKVLVATLDDASALAAKSAVETAGRVSDCVIVSQGADRSIRKAIGRIS